MGLANRRGSERRRVEIDKQLVHILAELGFDRLANDRRLVTSDAGLQLLQLARQRHADLVGPRAENLPELNERRAELFDGQANARFAAQVRERFAVAVFEEAFQERHIEPADPAGEAILAENGENFTPAIGVAIDVGDGGDFHVICMVGVAHPGARAKGVVFRALFDHALSGRATHRRPAMRSIAAINP
jgi:hypothetical protein